MPSRSTAKVSILGHLAQNLDLTLNTANKKAGKGKIGRRRASYTADLAQWLCIAGAPASVCFGEGPMICGLHSGV